MSSEVRRDLEDFLIGVLDLVEPIDWSTIRHHETPGWDSLVHMALLHHIEQTYEITLTPDEVTRMTDHAAVLEVLYGRGLPVY